MNHYCYSCRTWQKLNAMAMCAPCTTKWLSSTPEQRRALMHVVPTKLTVSPVVRPEMEPGW